MLTSSVFNEIKNNFPFKFETMWLLHPEFKDFVKNAWSYNGEFSPIDKFRAWAGTFKYLVKKWNKTTFGNLRNARKNLELS